MDNAVSQFFVFMGLIVTVALVAVIVSKNSNSAGLANSFFGGVAKDITAAVSPVTGATSGATSLLSQNLVNLGIGG